MQGKSKFIFYMSVASLISSILTLGFKMYVEFSSNLIESAIRYAVYIASFISSIMLLIMILLRLIAIKQSVKRIFPLILVSVTLLAMNFIIPFKSVYAQIDHFLYSQKRAEIIAEIEHGEVSIDSKGAVCTTPEENGLFGAEGIWVYRIDGQTIGIMCVTNSGLLETSSGFLYITKYHYGDYPYMVDYSILVELNGNWNYVST